MAASKTPLIVAAVVIVAVATVTLLARREAPGTDDVPLAPVGVATVGTTPQPVAPMAGQGQRRAGTGVMVGDRAQESLDRRANLREAHVARTTKAREEAELRFGQESVDPVWAPQKEVELTSFTQQPAFDTAGVAPRSLAIDCKSSMCRIDGSFASNGDAEDWILIYMSSVGSSMPNSIVSRRANPDGTTGVQIYGRAR